jgi:DnaJ family protein C protein 19
MVAAGVGLALLGFTGRYLLRRMPTVAEAMKTLPNFEEALSTSKYYRGGFEPKMTRREAALILGISPSASKPRIKVRFHKFILTILLKMRNLVVFIGST